MKYLFLITVLFFSCKSKQEKPINSNEKQYVENIAEVEISNQKIEQFIGDKMEAMNIPGLSMAIINKGKIVYHITKGYANIEDNKEVNQQTLFEGASISKSMFAYLAMQLVDEAKMELDRPLHQYIGQPFPGLDKTNEAYKEITARMVLSHSTGFPNWRGNSELRTQFKPGTKFGYSGEGYQYLVYAVQSILDTDYRGLESYFKEKIAIPLKMKNTTYIPNSQTLKNKASAYKNETLIPKQENPQEFNAAAGIHSEAISYSKWLINLMNKNGLTKESYHELFADQIATPKKDWFNKVGITNWTLGFAKHKFDFLDRPIYGHIGNNEGFTSLFLMDLSKKWGIVIFTNADQADDFGFELFKYLNNENYEI
ncbi:serine hydrolase domain-containing protein [uncultured Aquimarina sp.]|uniref:serine hydrolase domain-containing protein n=1 Tax=uncultured Aquimarina sp. TaxID=575652 RepID=UPI002631C35A|nr:serine hydrolase domain-containing protein [uncultured Aquimarina sp.]